MKSILGLGALALIIVGGCPQPGTTIDESGRSAASTAKGLTPGIYSGKLTHSVTTITTGAYNPGDPTRLNVTDPLRSACAGGLDDAGIQAFLTSAEADRKSGFSRAEETNIAIASCPVFECTQCLVAIVNQVYAPSVDQPNTAQSSTDTSPTIVVNEDGTVQSTPDTQQVSGYVMHTTTISENYAVGVGTQTYTVRLDIVNTVTGDLIISAFGQGTDTVRQTDANTLSLQSEIAVGVQDAIGSINIKISVAGSATK